MTDMADAKQFLRLIEVDGTYGAIINREATLHLSARVPEEPRQAHLSESVDISVEQAKT